MAQEDIASFQYSRFTKSLGPIFSPYESAKLFYADLRQFIYVFLQPMQHQCQVLTNKPYFTMPADISKGSS